MGGSRNRINENTLLCGKHPFGQACSYAQHCRCADTPRGVSTNSCIRASGGEVSTLSLPQLLLRDLTRVRTMSTVALKIIHSSTFTLGLPLGSHKTLLRINVFNVR